MQWFLNLKKTTFYLQKSETFYYFMNDMSSSWIWWQRHVSNKLGQKQQKAGKVSETKRKQLEEHVVIN